MWDERCSANFIVPEQVSPQKLREVCERLSPPPSTLLLLFQSTWLRRSTCGRVKLRRRTPLPPAPPLLHFQFVPVRSARSLHATSPKHGHALSVFFLNYYFILEESRSGSVTLLLPSPGKCADIAVRHRFRNPNDVVASAERAGGGSS